MKLKLDDYLKSLDEIMRQIGATPRQCCAWAMQAAAVIALETLAEDEADLICSDLDDAIKTRVRNLDRELADVGGEP